MLFNEIYGSYYAVTSAILREAVRGNLTSKKLTELVEKHAFTESFTIISDGLEGENWRLLHEDFSTPIMKEPFMPLTTLEKRWLKSLLLDSRIQLFSPDISGLEDVKPLFTPDMIVYYDRYSDGDNYKNPEYVSHFRTILQALQMKQNLYVCFESRLHEQLKLNLTPHYIEYSEKDDRFRLVTSNKEGRWIINLSRITQCELSNYNEQFPLYEAIKDSITFELEDRWNAMERILLHFSHLEKETKRLDHNKYRVTLKYDHKDETEMVIRILSFGSVIRVIEPENFINLIRARIRQQKNQNNFVTFLP